MGLGCCRPPQTLNASSYPQYYCGPCVCPPSHRTTENHAMDAVLAGRDIYMVVPDQAKGSSLRDIRIELKAQVLPQN